MVDIKCPYCGNRAKFVDSKVIYGRSYGMIYLCRPCDAYVGVHKGTDQPLGRLANAELRDWKKRAHAQFDPIWQRGQFKGNRGAAYDWLSKQMDLPKSETRIGMFDVSQCKRVVSVMENERKKYHG